MDTEEAGCRPQLGEQVGLSLSLGALANPTRSGAAGRSSACRRSGYCGERARLRAEPDQLAPSPLVAAAAAVRRPDDGERRGGSRAGSGSRAPRRRDWPARRAGDSELWKCSKQIEEPALAATAAPEFLRSFPPIRNQRNAGYSLFGSFRYGRNFSSDAAQWILQFIPTRCATILKGWPPYLLFVLLARSPASFRPTSPG